MIRLWYIIMSYFILVNLFPSVQNWHPCFTSCESHLEIGYPSHRSPSNLAWHYDFPDIVQYWKIRFYANFCQLYSGAIRCSVAVIYIYIYIRSCMNYWLESKQIQMLSFHVLFISSSITYIYYISYDYNQCLHFKRV